TPGRTPREAPTDGTAAGRRDLGGLDARDFPCPTTSRLDPADGREHGIAQADVVAAQSSQDLVEPAAALDDPVDRLAAGGLSSHEDRGEIGVDERLRRSAVLHDGGGAKLQSAPGQSAAA